MPMYSYAYNAENPAANPNSDSNMHESQARKQTAAAESKREIWDLRWIREPQQDRSARTRAQLLDATEKILDREGIDQLTITKVAGEAGCSVGSLYHHFQDKQTIIYAVLDRVARERVLTAEEGLELGRWEGVTLMGVLEGFMRYSLKQSRRLPGVIEAQRVLALQDPNIETRMYATNKKIHDLCMQLLRPRLEEVRHPDPNLAIRMVLSTLRATLNQRAQSFVPDARPAQPKQSDESFIREMLAMCRAYLGIDPEFGAADA